MRMTTWLVLGAVAVSGCSLQFTDEKASGTGSGAATGGSSSGSTSSSSATSSSGSTGASSNGSSGSGSATGSSGGGCQVTFNTARGDASPFVGGASQRVTDTVSVASVGSGQFGVAWVSNSTPQNVWLMLVGTDGRAQGTAISPPLEPDGGTICTDSPVGCIAPRVASAADGDHVLFYWSTFIPNNAGAPGVEVAAAIQNRSSLATTLKTVAFPACNGPLSVAASITEWKGAYAGLHPCSSDGGPGTELSPELASEIFNPNETVQVAGPTVLPPTPALAVTTDVMTDKSYFAEFDAQGLEHGPLPNDGGSVAAPQKLATAERGAELAYAVYADQAFAAYVGAAEMLTVVGSHVNGQGTAMRPGPTVALGAPPAPHPMQYPLGLAGGAQGFALGFLPSNGAAAGHATIQFFHPDGTVSGGPFDLGSGHAPAQPQVAYDAASDSYAVTWPDVNLAPQLAIISCR